jgi:hypothetical protein
VQVVACLSEDTVQLALVTTVALSSAYATHLDERVVAACTAVSASLVVLFSCITSGGASLGTHTSRGAVLPSPARAGQALTFFSSLFFYCSVTLHSRCRSLRNHRTPEHAVRTGIDLHFITYSTGPPLCVERPDGQVRRMA